jgi:hypothetical protein
VAKGYEKYPHPTQKGIQGLEGLELQRHLVESGRFERALALDDDLVSVWFRDPQSYPEELRKDSAVLWGSKGQNREKPDHVALLKWRKSREMGKEKDTIELTVEWYSVRNKFIGCHPALLRPAA